MKINKYKIQLAMANACITLNDLSDRANVSRVSITKFTSGKSNPRPVTVGKIARALNVKVEDLIE